MNIAEDGPWQGAFWDIAGESLTPGTRYATCEGVTMRLRNMPLGIQALMAIFLLILCSAITVKAAPATQPASQPSADLKLSVSSVSVDTKFQIYVGGGRSIEPPEPIGGGMPLISMGGGSTFMAGQLSSSDGKTKFVKVSCTITNSASAQRAFKLGEVAMTVAGTKANGFAGVGYNDRVCGMGGDDRKAVEQISVNVPANGSRSVTYIFPLLAPDSKKGELSLQNGAPVSFDIPSDSAK